MKDYIFRDLKTKKEKDELLEFFRYQANAEYGGHRLFDGTRTHLMHIPEELSNLIFFLKDYEKKKQKKFNNFLEVGFSTGKFNTILNKFFNFDSIFAIDTFSAGINSSDLLANLVRKNLTIICGRSDKKQNLDILKKFQPFDLIFVDGSHEYEDVKKDLSTFSNMLSNKGVLMAHDIKSSEHPGVSKAWNEFKKKKNFKYKELICKDYLINCGVGIAIKN